MLQNPRASINDQTKPFHSEFCMCVSFSLSLSLSFVPCTLFYCLIWLDIFIVNGYHLCVSSLSIIEFFFSNEVHSPAKVFRSKRKSFNETPLIVLFSLIFVFFFIIIHRFTNQLNHSKFVLTRNHCKCIQTMKKNHLNHQKEFSIDV